MRILLNTLAIISAALAVAAFVLAWGGCAASAPVKTTPTPQLRTFQGQSGVIQQIALPVIVRVGLSKTNFTIRWDGDASWATNFSWTFEVASNVSGPWWAAEQSRQPDAETNAYIKMHGAKFIRLQGSL